MHVAWTSADATGCGHGDCDELETLVRIAVPPADAAPDSPARAYFVVALCRVRATMSAWESR